MNHKSKNNVMIPMDIVKKIMASYISFLVMLLVISHALVPFVFAKTVSVTKSAEVTNPSADLIADTPAADVSAASTDDDDSSSNPAADVIATTPAADVSAASTDDDDSSSNPAADVLANTPASSKIDFNSSDKNNSKFVEITSISEVDLGEIAEGIETTIIPENEEESSISEVVFMTSSNLEEVKLTVSSYSGKPSEVKDIEIIENITTEVYKYLDIKLTSNETYVGETGIASMTFTFTVEKSWIVENNIDKLTVEMLRYHDDEWQHLNTTLISENDTVVVYEAETPGLSTFAVVGSEIVEVSASYVEETNEISWILNVVIIFSSTIILGVVLVKARFIYKNETKQ